MLVLLILVVAAVGTIPVHSTRHSNPAFESWFTQNKALIYFAALCFQSALFWIFCVIFLPKISVMEVVGETWKNAKDLVRDISIGIGAIAGVLCAAGLLFLIFGTNRPNISDSIIFPQTAVQFYLLFLVLVSGAPIEEIIFRGYLQKQLAFFFKSETIAVLAQAVLFSLAHVGGNWRSMFLKFATGAIFGFIAWQRKSLLPSMAAHAGINAIAAIAIGIH